MVRMKLPRAISARLNALNNRIANLVLRGVVRLLEVEGGLQVLQVSARRGQSFSDVERFAEFGFWSRPPEDGQAEAVLVFPGGNPDHPIAIAVEHRPTEKPSSVPPGGAAIYSAAAGTTVRVLPDGTVHIDAPGGCTITGALEVSGELEVSADATIEGTSFADLLTAYNAHTHQSASPGSPTSPPTPQIP